MLAPSSNIIAIEIPSLSDSSLTSLIPFNCPLILNSSISLTNFDLTTPKGISVILITSFFPSFSITYLLHNVIFPCPLSKEFSIPFHQVYLSSILSAQKL